MCSFANRLAYFTHVRRGCRRPFQDRITRRCRDGQGVWTAGWGGDDHLWKVRDVAILFKGAMAGIIFLRDFNRFSYAYLSPLWPAPRVPFFPCSGTSKRLPLGLSQALERQKWEFGAPAVAGKKGISPSRNSFPETPQHGRLDSALED